MEFMLFRGAQWFMVHRIGAYREPELNHVGAIRPVVLKSRGSVIDEACIGVWNRYEFIY